MTSLGYRSLPVLVTPDGASAAGAAASELARQLTLTAKETTEVNSKRSRHAGMHHAALKTAAVGHRHAHHLASELRQPEPTSKEDQP